MYTALSGTITLSLLPPVNADLGWLTAGLGGSYGGSLYSKASS